MSSIRLSVCIATLNRGSYIAETLDSILYQLPSDVEVVVVDGASKDCTQQVMEAYALEYPQIRYHREEKNSGVDADFDKAVTYAAGKYCWLMTDDDILVSGAIKKVLQVTTSNTDLVIVNSELRSADFSIKFSDGIVSESGSRRYSPDNHKALFCERSNYLSYIGSVVIKRETWLARNRESYYGSLFVHVGVIFQNPPLKHAELITDPLIVIRYGNAMWTPRRFEIWMFMWPSLIWSFPDFSDEEKSSITPRDPWKLKKNILLYKAIGGYSLTEYEKFIAHRTQGVSRIIYKLLALTPSSIISFFAVIYCLVKTGRTSSELYDISLSPNTGALGRWVARTALKTR